MWTCPKCGRTFKRVNQSHFCGAAKKPQSIEEYIQAQSPEKQADLWQMREILRAALPEAQEKISWGMPTFWQGHNLCHFAAAKHHIGFYPGPEAVAEFLPQLQAAGDSTDKGTVRIPYGRIDAELIGRIARWCAETGHHA